MGGTRTRDSVGVGWRSGGVRVGCVALVVNEWRWSCVCVCVCVSLCVVPNARLYGVTGQSARGSGGRFNGDASIVMVLWPWLY